MTNLRSGSFLGLVRDDARGLSWVRATVRDFAPVDWVLITYFVLLFVGVLFGAGPERPLAGRIVLEHLAALLAGLALTRGGMLKRGSFAHGLAYRLTLFLTFFSAYFELRVILPASAPRVMDSWLYAIDLSVFHYEPAVAWDRFVTEGRTEWFAFFYFGYFFIFALFVFPFMLAGRNLSVLARFAVAAFFTSAAGQLLYIVVPGYGPYHYLSDSFSHVLTGGFFWHAVKATVTGAGAQKDIFPSLHTATPVMLTLFAFRHRHESRPLRLSWPIVAFCSTQIVIATMYLRWHYLIDICAGLALAVITVVFADRVVTWDDARRRRDHLAPAWARLTFRPEKTG